MTKSLLTFLLLFAATTLNAQNSYKPQRGDILFQGAGNSEFSKSIAASTTADTVEFRPIHVAFIIHAADTPEKTFLIEAEPKLGVCITPLDLFLKKSAKTPDGKPKVTVKRLLSKHNSPQLTANAAKLALQLIGRPYDWVFLSGNDDYYCSELIQLSFLKPDGTYMFPYEPLNFTGPDGNVLPFWQKIYDSRGVDVPQGQPGTSPVGILNSNLLYTVHTYWK